MAMMEHWCPSCGHTEFNNHPNTPSACEKCGDLMRHTSDEEYDDVDINDEYDDDDDEDYEEEE